MVPEIGKNGLYLLRLRPHYRLRSIVVDPEEVVVDLHANPNDSITYTFYNPTRRSSIVVSGHLVEDINGFYRKLTSYSDDAIWRQSLVRRSLAQFDGGDLATGQYPPLMVAAQVADYLQVEEKTIRKWTSERTIPVVKLGKSVRYRKEEIDAAIKAGTIAATQPKTKKPKSKSPGGKTKDESA